MYFCLVVNVTEGQHFIYKKLSLTLILILSGFWSREPGLNWRPAAYKAAALPTELSRRFLILSFFLIRIKVRLFTPFAFLRFGGSVKSLFLLNSNIYES